MQHILGGYVMGKMYSIEEVVKNLGLDRTTVTRRMQHLKIRPQKGIGDGRYRYISEKDMMLLQDSYKEHTTHTISASDMQYNHPISRSQKANKMIIPEDILSRLEQLKAEVAMLKEVIQGITGTEIEYHPREPRQSKPKRRAESANYPLFPSDYDTLDNFCKRTGIPKRTITDAIAKGKLPQLVRGPWRKGRWPVQAALTPELQQNISVWYATIPFHKKPEPGLSS